MRRALLVAVVIAIPLLAHDLYLMPHSFSVRVGERLEIAVHNGDAFPESEISPVVARLVDARLLSASGASNVTKLVESGKVVSGVVIVPGEGDLLLTVRTTPNFIELAPDKFESYVKEEGLDHVLAWRAAHGETKRPGRERYSKFAKSLLVAGAANDFYKHVVGFPIEIVPQADPHLLKAGDKLPVQVLFHGQPAANLAVEAASIEHVSQVGRTDAQGRVLIPIDRAGKWRLHTLKMERCTDPAAADWESFWASFTFEIADAPQALTCPATIDGHKFQRPSIYNGTPGKEEYELAPDDEKNSAGRITQLWKLSDYRELPLFARCRYDGTSAVRVVDLKKELKTCTFSFKNAGGQQPISDPHFECH